MRAEIGPVQHESRLPLPGLPCRLRNRRELRGPRTPDDAAGPPRALAGFVRNAGGRPETRLSRLSRGIVASEMRIAIEIRGRQLAGEDITDLSVGDFDPRQFPIPERLTAAIHAALERGETNYPPPDGLPQLRQAVVDLFVRDLGLVCPLESVVITSGSRPAIYGTYLTVCDPGDRSLYPVSSWNNDMPRRKNLIG